MTPDELRAQFLARLDVPYDTATDLIADLKDRTDNSLASVNTLLQALEDIPQITFPSVPAAATLPDPNDGLPTAPTFASVPDISVPAPPAAPPISGITADPAPLFNPTPITVNIPAAPAPIVAGAAPSAPILPDVAIPAAPTNPFPLLNFPALPAFDASTLPAVLSFNYSEPSYTPALANELRQQILIWLQGGTGLPPAIEQALFARAYDRQEQINYREEQRIRADWASRGWQLPPGAMAKQIQAVREQGMLQTSETAREILVKAAEWEIENLRQAVSQGIAFEKLLSDSFHQMAERSFNVAKYRLEADIARLNAEVSVYNLAVTLFEAQLKGELAKVEAGKLEVDIYQAKMEGARIHAEVNKTRIEAYRADISAWAEKIAARKIEFDAYETQVKAETAKIGLRETEARAFAATVEAYKSGNDVKIQNVKIQIEQLEAGIKRHNLLLDSEKAKMQAKVAQLNAQLDRYKAELSGYSTVTDAKVKLVTVDFEVRIKHYQALVTQLVQQSELQREAIKAIAQIHTQLAAGAMSAVHVSSSLSGSAAQSITDNTNYSF